MRKQWLLTLGAEVLQLIDNVVSSAHGTSQGSMHDRFLF
jgi:hypothetical protein